MSRRARARKVFLSVSFGMHPSGSPYDTCAERARSLPEPVRERDHELEDDQADDRGLERLGAPRRRALGEHRREVAHRFELRLHAALPSAETESPRATPVHACEVHVRYELERVLDALGERERLA